MGFFLQAFDGGLERGFNCVSKALLGRLRRRSFSPLIMNGVRTHFVFASLRRSPADIFASRIRPTAQGEAVFHLRHGGRGGGEGCMSSIKMNGELVPLSKEVLFPSDKSEVALVDMQRGQRRLCTRRKPPIYGQTLLHITLTTSREETELGESQAQPPCRRCRNHRGSKAGEILQDLSVYMQCCEAARLVLFFSPPEFRPQDGCS